MQERHDRDLKESVMLEGLAFQTSWLMQNVHDKSENLPDPDPFTFDSGLHLSVHGGEQCGVFRADLLRNGFVRFNGSGRNQNVVDDEHQ